MNGRSRQNPAYRLASHFALAATGASGWWLAAAAGLAFALGMMATDAANGLWVNRLIVRAGDKARGAARSLAAAIGVVSLGVAALARFSHGL